MTTADCWLCEANLSEGTFKVKRKKLHGTSMKKAVNVLESIASEYLDVDLVTTTEFQKGDYLCHRCFSLVDGLATRKKEILRMEEELVRRLRQVIKLPSVHSERERECDDSNDPDDEMEVTAAVPHRHSTPRRRPARPPPSSVTVSFL